MNALAIPFLDAEHRLFRFDVFVHVLCGFFAAKVGPIDFDMFLEKRRVFVGGHRVVDVLEHEPSRFLCHRGVLCQLRAGDALGVSSFHVYHHQPLENHV